MEHELFVCNYLTPYFSIGICSLFFQDAIKLSCFYLSNDLHYSALKGVCQKRFSYLANKENKFVRI